MKDKYFLITVDTEGDNLWQYKAGEIIETKNADFIPPFQSLCERYDFKPVYLTNYEMAQNESFINHAKEWLSKGTCEIGVHLHAWNNPPFYELKGTHSGNPYLIEYPEDIMRAKFSVIYELLKTNFSITPVSHRAGRWAMNDLYFQILKDFNIKVDCSYTPGVNWSQNMGITQGGVDYSHEPRCVQIINGVMEIPATIRHLRTYRNGSFKHRIKSILMGEYVWLRTAGFSAASMKKVLDVLEFENDVDFAEFMIHSSELMPGGSPLFVTQRDVKKELSAMEEVFAYAKTLGYKGCTLAEYYRIKNEDL